ncbi:uncharacterized protein TrAtP1_003308 [Trichoderma atroviride]|uniref:uncharacterized protein n=1 Tax=Hypocrea atroviridis TaxID=63577 RepID=UPI00332A3674|nr:hypothetical protein TrAtP1_003308 [Trichoderma atroviride]
MSQPGSSICFIVAPRLALPLLLGERGAAFTLFPVPFPLLLDAFCEDLRPFSSVQCSSRFSAVPASSTVIAGHAPEDSRVADDTRRDQQNSKRGRGRVKIVYRHVV